MNVLWIAFTIYIIGIASILYYRPALMFRQDGGTWKEFGLSTKGSYTVFPFWLFTILWAFFSYLLATMGTIFVASAATNSYQSPIQSQQTMPSLFSKQTTNYAPPTYAQNYSPLPPTFAPPSPTYPPPQQIQQPGYYVLESRPSGQPKYVYFGLQPPKQADL